MYSVHGDRSFSCRVSPFRYLRIKGYLLLPVAFRSLSRLSSALSAKASTLRSYSLDHTVFIALKTVNLHDYMLFFDLSIISFFISDV